MGSNDDYCSCEHYFGLSLRHEFPNESYNELLPDDYGEFSGQLFEQGSTNADLF